MSKPATQTKRNTSISYQTVQAADMRWVTQAGGDELKIRAERTRVAFRREVTTPRMVCLVGMIASIMAPAGTWARFVSVATEPLTAATVEPSTAAIFPFALMFGNRNALPVQYYNDPFRYPAAGNRYRLPLQEWNQRGDLFGLEAASHIKIAGSHHIDL